MGTLARVVVTGLLCGAIFAPAFAQTMAGAETHWVRKALSHLRHDALLVGLPDGLIRPRRPDSRYEIAVGVHATAVRLDSVLHDFELLAARAPDAPRTHEDLEKEPEIRENMKRLPAWLADLDEADKLAAEFRPEMQSLGIPMPEILATLQSFHTRIPTLRKQAPAIVAKVSSFPDTAENHWVFEALKNMKKDGLLVADTSRDRIPSSRCRVVFWVLSTYDHLMEITDGLDERIRKLSASLDGKASKEDLQKTRDALDALQRDVSSMKDLGGDIVALYKLVVTFSPEISALGRDPAAIKRSLSDLRDRTRGCTRPPYYLFANLDAIALSGYGHGVTIDGRPTSGSALLQEESITFATSNDEGFKAKSILVFGDMLSRPGVHTAFGDQSQTVAGQAFGQGPETVYLQELDLSLDSCLFGDALKIEAGRLGLKLGPYFLQRPDTTPAFDNDRWDNGLWSFDGGILSAKSGPMELEAFAGAKNDDFLSGWIGNGLQPMRVGRKGGSWNLAAPSSRPLGLAGAGQVSMPVDEVYGLHFTTPMGETAQFKLIGMWLDADRPGSLGPGLSYNRLAVYGGTLAAKCGTAKVEAGYGSTSLNYNQRVVVDSQNQAWWASACVDEGNWGFTGGYKEIGANYAAPGDWGRIGLWWNPTDLRGFSFGAKVDLAEHLGLTGTGEWYSGIDDALNEWGSGQKVDRYVAELRWEPNYVLALNLTGEHVGYHGLGGPQPTERWLTVGLTYNYNANVRFKLTWQAGRVDSDGASAFMIDGRSTSTGGLLVGQLSCKY